MPRGTRFRLFPPMTPASLPFDETRRRPSGFRRAVAQVLLLAVVTSPLAAQWRVEGWFGDALNLPTTLTLEQDGEPDILVDADWSTRPWRPTWYYSFRIAKWSGNSAWAFEYMHHKLYLDNPPVPEVIRFRITNGINNLLAERHWRVKGWELGVGAGPALAVPVSTVRGKSLANADGIFGSTYELAGFTVMGTVARRVKLFPYTYGSFAIKATVTPLDVSIADGRGKLTNYALHFQYGLSLQGKP